MQQALYNTIRTHTSTATANTPSPVSRTGNTLRGMARKWDMLGVLALMGSSAAYGIFALAHLGL